MQLLLGFEVFEACVLHLKAVPKGKAPPQNGSDNHTAVCVASASTPQGTFWKDDVNWVVWSSRRVIQKSIIPPQPSWGADGAGERPLL